MSKNPAFQTALKLLTARDYSEFTLRRKLIEKQYDEDLVKKAIEKCHSYGYIQEKEYAHARIKGLARKGYSPSHIRQKLEQEEIYYCDDEIRAVFNEYGINELDLLYQLIEKKVRNLTLPLELKDRQKIMRYLASKGYSQPQALSALNNYSYPH